VPSLAVVYDFQARKGTGAAAQRGQWSLEV